MANDVAIVGCGLAGATLAALLAERGHHVTVLEKTSFPRDKLCGEFLSTETIGLLERTGCLAQVMAKKPALMTRTHLTTASGASFTYALPGTALGFSRVALDTLLMEHARARGAVVVTEATVSDIVRHTDDYEVAYTKAGERLTLRARVVIGSQGRRTRLDRTLSRPFAADRSSFFGFKAHQTLTDDAPGRATAAALAGTVEVHAFPGGYGGLCFTESGAVNLCMLLDRSRIAGKVEWERVRNEILPRNPTLATRLAGLRDDGSEVQAVAQVPFVMKEQQRDGVFFVGDAAGMIAPAAGDGQAMAIDSAHFLASFIHEALGNAKDIDRIAGEWQRAWRRRYGMRLRVGGVFQNLLLRGATASAALRAASAFPPLGRAVIALTRG